MGLDHQKEEGQVVKQSLQEINENLFFGIRYFCVLVVCVLIMSFAQTVRLKA